MRRRTLEGDLSVHVDGLVPVAGEGAVLDGEGEGLHVGGHVQLDGVAVVARDDGA